MAKRNKTVPIVIGVVLIAAAGGYLVYRSKRNEAEGNAMLEFIKGSVSQTDHSQAAKDQISTVKALGTKLDPNRIKIGTLSGKATDPRIRDMMAKTNVEIASAMMGAGTKAPQMLSALAKIKSKNTLAYMDKVFKAQYKEGLFDMMHGEREFFNSDHCKASEKTNTVTNALFPMFSDGCWAPWIAEWIYRLPEY